MLNRQPAHNMPLPFSHHHQHHTNTVLSYYVCVAGPLPCCGLVWFACTNLLLAEFGVLSAPLCLQEALRQHLQQHAFSTATASSLLKRIMQLTPQELSSNALAALTGWQSPGSPVIFVQPSEQVREGEGGGGRSPDKCGAPSLSACMGVFLAYRHAATLSPLGCVACGGDVQVACSSCLLQPVPGHLLGRSTAAEAHQQPTNPQPQRVLGC